MILQVFFNLYDSMKQYRWVAEVFLSMLHINLSQNCEVFYSAQSKIFFILSNTFFFCPMSILLDVWLDQPQQRIVPAESHGDRCELPTCPWPADTAQSLCHEFNGEFGGTLWSNGSVCVIEVSVWGCLHFKVQGTHQKSRKVRLGCGSSPLSGKQFCSVHPDTDMIIS